MLAIGWLLCYHQQQQQIATAPSGFNPGEIGDDAEDHNVCSKHLLALLPIMGPYEKWCEELPTNQLSQYKSVRHGQGPRVASAEFWFATSFSDGGSGGKLCMMIVVSKQAFPRPKSTLDRT